MKRILVLLFALIATTSLAADVGPFIKAAQYGVWNLQLQDGSGNPISSTAGALNVNISSGSITIGGTVAVTQSGVWTTGRTWTLLNTTDSVNVGNFPATQAVTQSTSPWVVSGSGTFLVDGSAHTQPISAASLPLPSGASTSALQSTGNSSLASIDSKITTTVNGIKVDGSAVTQPVSGTVTANAGSGNFTVVQPTGTNLHVNVDNTIPISGTITANQGTSPWVVGGTVTANAGTGTLLVDGSAHTQPVSGTVAATQGTSPWVVSTAQLPATLGAKTIANSTAVNIASDQIVPVSGSVTVSGTVAATQSGTWTTGRTWTLLNTTDSVNVGNFPATQAVTQSTSPWVISGTVTANAGTGTFLVDGSAHTQPVSGTVAVTQSTSPWVVSTAQLPTTLGAKTIANSTAVNIASDQTVPISGSVSVSNFPATTAVTQSTSPWVENVSQFGGSNVVTGVGNSGAGIPRVTVSSDSNITNISGTISLPTGASTSANQTSGGQKSQVVDGANATVGPVQTLSGTNYMPVVLASSATPGSAAVARSVQIAGSDGTNARTVSTDTSGNVNVNVVSTSSASRSTVVLVRNDYSSTNVTTAAYVQLVASTSDTINQFYIFDSSGQTLFLAVGAAASEVNKYYIVPGGNGLVNLTIPAASRISVKAVSANATSGELSITFIK